MLLLENNAVLGKLAFLTLITAVHQAMSQVKCFFIAISTIYGFATQNNPELQETTQTMH